MRAINAPIPFLLRAYKETLTPSSIPRLFPLPHAPRPAKLLAGVLQTAAVFDSIPARSSLSVPPVSSICFPLSRRIILTLLRFVLCSRGVAPRSSPLSSAASASPRYCTPPRPTSTPPANSSRVAARSPCPRRARRPPRAPPPSSTDQQHRRGLHLR